MNPASPRKRPRARRARRVEAASLAAAGWSGIRSLGWPWRATSTEGLDAAMRVGGAFPPGTAPTHPTIRPMAWTYLDNNATTQPAPQVLAAVREMHETLWAN